jgi:hypothetical protein
MIFNPEYGPHLFSLALLYHIQCERYDLLVCIDPESGKANFKNGSSSPCTPKQLQLVMKNSSMVKSRLAGNLQADERSGFYRAITDIAKMNWSLERMREELESINLRS